MVALGIYLAMINKNSEISARDWAHPKFVVSVMASQKGALRLAGEAISFLLIMRWLCRLFLAPRNGDNLGCTPYFDNNNASRLIL